LQVGQGKIIVDPDEKRAERWLADRGFTTQRFSKEEMRCGKTPDFRVLKGNGFRAFCEVKSSPEDQWLNKQIEKAPPGAIAGGSRSDPIFNRLAADVHEAVKQFDSVNVDNTQPNILVLVNHDAQCGFNDLLAVLTGNFHAADGTSHPIYRKYSQGRIKDEKDRIDLFIWLDDHKPERLLFSQKSAANHQSLCTALGISPDDIKQIDS
jgi:hypothetical protein